MEKTVIHVFTHKVSNLITDDKRNFWGLGDIIRGTIKLYYLSKQMGFKLIVDIQLHPISHFLQPLDNPYSDLIKENKHNILHVSTENIEQHIESSTESVVYFLTNASYDGPIDDECKEFIKRIFIPNTEFQEYIDEQFDKMLRLPPPNLQKIAATGVEAIPTAETESNEATNETTTIVQTTRDATKMPNPKYNILHIRTGDHEMINKQNTDLFNIILPEIIMHKSPNDIFISDSYNLKQYVKKSYNLFIFDTKPVHIGYHTNIEDVKETLFEFFLLAKSQKIKTYSVYDWVSGFTYWPSQIYDIPLINLGNVSKKRVFITFGGPTEDYRNRSKIVRNEAKDMQFFTSTFGLNDYFLSNNTEFWNKHGKFIESNKRGFGYWLWKPFIIKTFLDKLDDGAILIYADSGCTMNPYGKNRLFEYINMLHNNPENYGIISFQLQNHPEIEWTKRSVCDYFEATDDMMQSNQCMATSVIIKKNEHSQMIINKWYETVCNYSLINDEVNSNESLRLKEHRHDQSIYSMLVKKYGSIKIPDETYFNPWSNGQKSPILGTRIRK